MKKIIACIIIAIALVGCSSEGISNRFIRTNDTGSYPASLGYLIDSKTGVVYLEYDAYASHAITVMLNADGTPVTVDQLGLEVDEE